MSERSQGEGWWLASDGKYYPPASQGADVAPPVAGGRPKGFSRGIKWLIGGTLVVVILVGGLIGVGFLLLGSEEMPPTNTGTLVLADNAKIAGPQCSPLPSASPDGIVSFEHWSTSLPNGTWLVGGCSDAGTSLEMWGSVDLEANESGLYYDISAVEAHIPKATSDVLRREQAQVPVFLKQAQEEQFPGTLVTVGRKATRPGADVCYPFEMGFTDAAQAWSGKEDKPTMGRGITCVILPAAGQSLISTQQWIEYLPKDQNALVPTMTDEQRDSWLDPFLDDVVFSESA